MTTEHYVSLPTEGPPAASVIRGAVEALARGELVGLPTETVYGLAVRADDADAVARLAKLKGSGPAPPFSLHLGSTAGLQASVCLPAIAGRLAERYWPGPLTLVLQASEGGDSGTSAESERAKILRDGLAAVGVGGWAGLRVPSQAATAAILAAAPFPVLMTSANAGDEPPALDAQALRGAFDAAQVPMLLDGGAAAIGEPSTVLAVGPGRFELLRKGIVGLGELQRSAGRRLLFVCTGNTCRSPMAEALARHSLRAALDVSDETAFGFEVASAGVYAGPGAPASENSVQSMADRGIDLADHASRPAIDREVAEFDHVYCLTASHREALLGILPPSAAGRIELLDPEGRDVPDPYGGPLDIYRKTADVIEGFIKARLSDWV